MTTPFSGASVGWREWDASAWGRGLFKHSFVGHDARPVSRLAISPEELARAAGALQSEAAAARDAFLGVIRCSPSAFRRHLSADSLEAGAWDRAEPPPFLAYLLFTCFAAASLEADIANEGVFRERVRQLLGHPTGTSYALADLSKLWEFFAVWLETQHNEGVPCRILRLPDRGRMNLIGYSVRLAFPRRADRLRLCDVLSASTIGPNLTVPEAFQAVGRARGFSAEFCEVFGRARTALANGDDTPELQALWSAILEAATLTSKPSRLPERGRLQLLAQEDGLGQLDLFVVAAGARMTAPNGLRFTRLDEPFDDFDHVLGTTDGATPQVATLLLQGSLQDRAPAVIPTQIDRAIREGVLLFQRADSAIWKLATTRPREGRMRALVRTRLCDEFLRLLIRSRRIARETKFAGWRELIDFDITELADPHDGTSVLASVRCLQRIDVGPQLHFVGGIPVDGGFLGIRGLLPEAHCPKADEVVVFQFAEGQEGTRPGIVTKLVLDEDRPSHFVWPADAQDMEGRHLIAGMNDGRVVAPREILFHSRGLSHEYAGPTDPSRWLVEACATDMAPADGARDVFLAEGILRGGSADLGSIDGIPMFTEQSVDHDPQHDRLVEALAAISAGRKGMAEFEVCEIFQRIVPNTKGIVFWGVLRGWIEAGYLDCLTKRNWRGRTYFARQPRFVLMSGDREQQARVVLHGLAPYRLRTAVRGAFESHGAGTWSAASLSRSVPAPMSWNFESAEHAMSTIAAFAELRTSGVHNSKDLAGDFDTTIATVEMPPGYERQRAWDWVAGGFRRPSRYLDSSDVRIEYYTRTNGPDRYVVSSDGEQCVTASRSWALLNGFRRARRKPFVAEGSHLLLREGVDGPQVPLPIARSIGLRSGIASGPGETSAQRRYYAYATEQSNEQRWLLGWLSGAKVDDALIKRFAWLREAAARCYPDAVPLPFDLRQRLRKLESVPGAPAMADQRVPRFLLSHVRRAVDLAGG